VSKRFVTLGLRSGLLVGMLLLLAACDTTTASIRPAATATGPGDVAAIGQIGGDLAVVGELPPPPNTDNGRIQLVAENDILEVDVFRVDELDRTGQVDASGRISLPLIGAIEVAGKTLEQVEKDIERAYAATYLQSPDVTVFMKESFGQRLTIDGEVRKAGIYPSNTRSSLIDVVAQAGGLTEIADANKVFVFRDYGSRRLVAQYSIDQIRKGKQPDPRLFGGDVIVVFASGAKVAGRNLREALGLASSASVFF
jgi:polysaccharide biosynthesis/export protein